MLTHPSYAAAPPERWLWVVATYSTAVGDSGASQRIRVYELVLCVVGSALARMLYEVPRGLDPRLVERGPS